ncbi:Ubiquitin-like domain-containing protein [Aphelenchoides besseyi]|nr:Ubiquitin-like domain-containing protein [Aphelenchoides besseyi]
MELCVELHDQDGVVHEEFRYKFDNESTLDQLNDEIQSTWNINTKYQQLFLDDGQKLVGRGANSLQSFRLKDCDKVVVKHSMLSHWSALLECETAFQQTNEPELKKSIHTRSKGIVKALVDSLFFVTYANFNSRCTSIEKKFLTHFDRKFEAIKDSCRIYFKKIYGENVKLTFNSREDGSRSGCICTVEDQSAINKFFVKTHHGAGDKSSYTRYDIDLKELFVYKFLENLKIGAEIHFIGNEAFSKWIIYIASREIPAFKTLELVELMEENVNEYSKCVVQMLVLMLGDHHTANLGVDGAGNPFIVDFIVIGKPLASIKDLYDFVHMAKKFNVNLGTFNERLEISLDYLRESNFLAILDSSVESFLQDEKLMFDKLQKTDDLKEYLENVRKNVKSTDSCAQISKK